MAQKSLKKNAILNGIKQCCAIVFPLITFPYASRVLGNDGFGKYSFSYSVVSYFLLFAALGINTYAIREGSKIRDDKVKLEKFASEIFSINIFSVAVSYLLLFITLNISAKIQSYIPYILIQSVSMILTAVGTDWINSIYEDFSYITIRYILVQVIALILMFTFVKDSSDVIPYCVVSVIASTGGNALNLFYVRKYVKIRFTICMELKKNLLPLITLFINSVAIAIYVNSDITMLGFYYEDSVVGIYSFASKIYNILKQLVYAILVVAVPRIAYLIQKKPDLYKQYMNKIFMALTLFLLPIVSGTFGMSKTIIAIAGGNDYIAGNVALKILSPALFFAIYAALFSNCALIVFGDEKKCLRATCVSALVNITLNFILLPILGIAGAALTTLIAEWLNCMIQMKYSSNRFNVCDIEWKSAVSCVAGGCLILIICAVCNAIIEYAYGRMVISVLLSVLVYFLVLVAMKHPLVFEILWQLKKRMKKSLRGKSI